MNLLDWLSSKNISSSEWVILGNGPSISGFQPWDGVATIGFNRVDRYLEENNVVLDIYIGCSDNAANPDWGEDWCKSTVKAMHRSKVGLLSQEVIDAVAAYGLLDDEIREKIYVVDEYLMEPKLFQPSAFPFARNKKESILKLSKSGTSVNIAYSLLAALNPRKVFLYGCDLGWQSSKGEKDSDKNHYFADYRAKISSPFLENIRMDFVHLNFFRQMSNSVEVVNMSDRSIIKYFNRPHVNGGMDSEPPSRMRLEIRRFILLVDEAVRLLKRLLLGIKRFLHR